MKFIVAGLGSFGASLSTKLTADGNEVIGVDADINKVEHFKNDITHTICMDATDEQAIAGLPLADTDVVIVAIGEDEGANIMCTAIFKNNNVKRIICRSINPLHEKVLQAIGVDEVVHPEEETAERWAKKLCLRNVVDSFELSKDKSIIEIKTPAAFVGKSLQEIGLRSKFNILVLTTIKMQQVTSFLGKPRVEKVVQDVATPQLVLEEGDILVVFGNNKDLNNFLSLRNVEQED